MINEVQLIKEINCEDSFISRLYSNGIIEVYYNTKMQTVEIADLLKLKQSVIELGKGKNMPLYMEILAFSNISAEGRMFAASNNFLEPILGTAILIDNLAKRMMLNFYLTINKPIKATRGFSSKATALEWLMAIQAEVRD